MNRSEQALVYGVCLAAFVIFLFAAFAINLITGDAFSAAMPLAAGAAFLSVGLGGMFNLSLRSRRWAGTIDY